MNPFSSHFVCPSKCRFVLPDNLRVNTSECNESVLARLSTQLVKQPLVQIVGPHGSGKTTLAIELARRTENRFASIHSVILRKSAGVFATPEIQWNSEPPFTASTTFPDASGDLRLLLVDGIESLGQIQRRIFLRQFTSSNFTILITTHRFMIGVKILTRIKPELNQFEKIVAHLQTHSETSLSQESIAQCYRDSGGNFRDAIWSLYDCWQQQAEQA